MIKSKCLYQKLTNKELTKLRNGLTKVLLIYVVKSIMLKNSLFNKVSLLQSITNSKLTEIKSICMVSSMSYFKNMHLTNQGRKT